MQGITKPRLTLVSDVRQFAGVEGPFSPLAGGDSLTFCGGRKALADSHAVDVPTLDALAEDRVTEATDAAGHTWFLRLSGTWLIVAFRERTAAELVEENDRADDMRLTAIPSNRVQACRRIAFELGRMAGAMAPDRCPPRSRRRALQRRIADLAALQADLLYGRSTPMSEVRRRMGALGL
ncbi:hypothetical protein [Variovorax sp. UMC13]|uniref:hypothetical protein n=1 Tax=Variovorax sp. UMC13 TaxID=1862326 RepID=UPI0015FF3FBB|nr:hypothetical protein [Variovorax sp. UMC13]MBB1601072.1 hypothetical protein [Variovorax sp. UMC13]